MQRALGLIAQLRTRAARAGIANHRQYNNGWHTAMDLQNMLTVSEAITRAALLRKESRGAQFREDFPNKDPGWGKYNIAVRRGGDGEMLVERRPVAAATKRPTWLCAGIVKPANAARAPLKSTECRS
jgi:succinate dehydrogenase / fumarate reductase flavoprotein subunit